MAYLRSNLATEEDRLAFADAVGDRPAPWGEAGPVTVTDRDLPVVVIVGPTAVGKTEVTLEVAQRLGADVISADSMQVYRGLDIGTAKPTPAERAMVPHHLIDIVEPTRSFSVADWVALVRPLLGTLRGRGRIPLVSGGTPLYHEVLFGRFTLAPCAPPQPELRASLGRLAERFGPAHLHGQLRVVDPVAAARIHPADQKRTVRALEVYLSTGRPLSGLERQAAGESRTPSGRVAFFGLWRPQEELVRRIEARVAAMFDRGLVEEVRGLIAAGAGPQTQAMQGVGYKEVAAYLAGRSSLGAAIGLVIRNTRRLAKRQMTWFRADPRIHWLRAGINMQAVVEDIATLTGGKACP